MYSVEQVFWLKVLLILTTFGLLLFLFNTLMRKLLKVKKKNPFSYNHLNNKHKIIDWTIRITFIFIISIGSYINILREPLERIWFLEPYFTLFTFIIASETARAIIEWKYDNNRNAYIFTLSQLLFIVLFLLTSFLVLFDSWLLN